MNISHAVKNARLRKGIRQKYAAIELGVTQTYLSLIESGSKEPSMSLLQDMCILYSIPAAMMFWLTIEEKDIPCEKKIAFRELKPLVDNLISQMF